MLILQRDLEGIVAKHRLSRYSDRSPTDTSQFQSEEDGQRIVRPERCGWEAKRGRNSADPAVIYLRPLRTSSMEMTSKVGEATRGGCAARR
jgi:transposase